MQPIATGLDGPIVLEPDVHGDERGFFAETLRESALEALGIRERWVQDNQSRSDMIQASGGSGHSMPTSGSSGVKPRSAPSRQYAVCL